MEANLAGMLPEVLLIDLPEIDVQHEEIFRRIESLKTASYGSAPPPCKDFESLLDYLKHHFQTEEGVALQVGAPFAEHARVHRKNLRTLCKALREVEDGRRDEHSFLRYIEYWFERHINEEDKPFAASVRACRTRSADDPSPAENPRP